MKLFLVVYSLFFGFNLCFAQSQSPEVERERLKRKIAQLTKQNINLNAALTTAKENEEELRGDVKVLTERLSAYGLYGGSKDERLLQAVSDSRIMNKQLSSLRLVSDELAVAVRKFVEVAQVNDPNKRKEIEVALRKFNEEASGLKVRANRQDSFGSVQSAKVISIDVNSGMLVINVGKNQSARLGAQFKLLRGDRELGHGRVVEVRDNVAGVLIVSKIHPDIVFKIGDSAQIILDRRG